MPRLYTPRFLSAILLLLILCLGELNGQQLRICSYNMSDHPQNATDAANLKVILGEIRDFEIFGQTRALDLLGFQEGPSSASSYNSLENDFEDVYGGNYESVISNADPAGDRTGFVYNTSTLTLLASQNLSAGLTHNTLRARFRPVGGSAADEFYAYSIHLKAGFDDASTRAAEAATLRNNADSLPAGSNILYMGDFNIRGSDEGGWMEFVSSGNGQAIDSINAPFGLRADMDWNGSLAMLPFQTQNPVDMMDDRFDVLIFTENLVDGEDLEYKRGSVRVLGNNGTHQLDGTLSSGNGANGFIDNLIDFSDHLPVFADFEFGQSAGNLDESAVIDAFDNETVRPDGPRQGSVGEDFFNVEGDLNNAFASFGVIDFDLSGLTGNGPSASDAGNVVLDLSQSNAGFTRNSPIAVYLASEAASEIVIDSSITYQTGNNMIDCVPAVLANGAEHLATFAFFGRNNSGSTFPAGTLDRISLNSVGLKQAVIDALNGDRILRLIVTPEAGNTAATHAGFGNGSIDGPSLTFDYSTAVGTQEIPPSELNIVRGFLVAGELADLNASDNSYVRVQPGITLTTFEPPVWLEFDGTTPIQQPSQLSFTIEARADTVGLTQAIEIFNFDNNTWDLFDVQPAQLSDSVITINLNGELARFINNSDGQITTRATWRATGPIFLFPWTISVDEIRWTVTD